MNMLDCSVSSQSHMMIEHSGDVFIRTNTMVAQQPGIPTDAVVARTSAWKTLVKDFKLLDLI